MKTSKLIFIAIAVIIVGYVIYTVATRPTYNLEAGERPFKGRADASIIIDEYSDFQCPACRSAAPLLTYLDEQYGANIRINYNHFPLRSIHPNAYPSALAAECANDQGKFWEMHDFIFGYQDAGQSKANLRLAATDAELDLAQYDACVATKARKSVVDEDLSEASALGLGSTPSFLYNGVYVQNRGEIESMIRRDLGLPELEQ